MGRFLKALEKVGLVEVEHDLNESPTDPISPSPITDDSIAAPAELVPSPPVTDGTIAEGQPFDAFYSAIPASPFPAEKMLKLLDGLQAMDLATRQSAVKAMDAADDSWSLDGSVADAKAKIAALSGHASVLTGQVTAIEKQTAADIKALETETDQAVAAIRKQISDLEALLSRHVEKSGADKATAQNRVQSAREACTRETGRLHAEASRLNTLIELFGPGKEA